MIKSTFILIPGIGEKTEVDFWSKGVLTWDELKDTNSMSKAKRRVVRDYLNKAERALNNYDTSFFSQYLPQKEYWRVYNEFSNNTLFLDIETTGPSLYYDKITLIGCFDGKNYRTFVKDNNLSDFIDYLKNYKILVTFNGKIFDVPFILKELPETENLIPPIHIDLRYLSRSIGVSGSLKKVEKQLGIERPKEVEDISGREAVVLWNRFLKGENDALERLILYNYLDTVNLQEIMHYCYKLKLENIKSKINSNQQTLLECGEQTGTNKPLYLDLRKPPRNPIPEVLTKSLDNGFLELLLNNEKLSEIDRSKIEKIDVKIESLLHKIKQNGNVPICVGIDLSGSEKRHTGICMLKGTKAYLDVARTDEEIITKTMDANPTLISIDSPLSLPEGRCCSEDSCECRKHGITRECERILKKRGINVYPCLINSMQKLTARGIKLTQLFEKHGYEVIESYPGAAQDILCLPRKRVNLEQLEVDLMSMGIKPKSERDVITHDEIDALTSALVGYFYLAENYEAVGNINEGYLIVPLAGTNKD